MLLPVGQHQQTDLALGIAFGRSGHGGKNHPVAVLHQRVPKVGQTRLLAVAVPVQPSRRGRWSTHGLVGALLATKIRVVAIVRTILPLEALLRIPGPARHADDGEVIVRYQPPGLLQHAGRKLLGHVGGEQPVAVHRERGVVSQRVVHAQAHRPAEGQVVVQLLDQLPLCAPSNKPAKEAPGGCAPTRSKADRWPSTGWRTHRSTITTPGPGSAASRAMDDPSPPAALTSHN